MRYLFGDYALDTHRCELRRTGTLIKLRPKVFDILTYLIAHRDRVITRQELLEHLWSQQFVGEATLNSCIMEARQAVGDTGQGQRLIQTLHGRGYRFVAAVAEASDSPPAEATHALSALGRASTPEDLGQAVVHRPALGRAAPASAEGSSASPEGLEGERKQVTILCCALADARGVAAHVGSEAMYRLMQGFFALAQRVVQRYAGTLTQRLSDGFVAFFGVPVAQEDHPRRAVLAALELQQRTREAPALWEQLRGASLATSMGLHTGMVIVGPLGEDAQTLYAALDDTTDMAGRLQRLAGPDTILISESTCRLVQAEVRVEVYDAVDMAALPRPLSVYRVCEVMIRRSGVAGRGGRLLSPFVGRTREQAALQALLAQVEAGQGQVVGIVGEPGIGKSRLLYEFARGLRDTAVEYLETYCFAYDQASPYGPVLGLLRQLCGMTDADGPEAMTTKLRHCLREAGMTLDADAPYLLTLLGLPEGTAPLTGLSPEVRKARTLALLRHVSLHSHQGRPRVMAVENVHWSDPSSEEYLALLADSLSGARILLVTTYRPGYRPPWLDKSYATQLALPPLRPQDSRTVVRFVLSYTPNPGPWEQAIVTTGAGNPFFLEELAWAVREGGVEQPTAMIPDTVQAVLAARIDRLPPEEKRLLQTAAVIGHEVPLRLLQVIAEMPENVLQRGLTHLQAAEFLYETRPLPDVAYIFKHALTHEVAYDSLLLERRHALHARIVDAIEGFYADQLGEQVERLAHHAFRGEVWDKALRYCRQAGEKAEVRSACREAVEYFEEALSALAHLPETRATREQAIDLRFALYAVLMPLGNSGRILACLREAESLAATLDDQRRLRQVALFLPNHFYRMGAYDQAIAAAQRAITLAMVSGEVALHAQANYYLGTASQAQGDYRRAIDCFRQTVASLEGTPLHERFGLPNLPAVLSRAYLAVCYAELGMFVEGRALGEEGLRIAEAVAHPGSLMRAYHGLGLLALRQGDLPSALPRLERALGICQDADLPAWFHWMAATLGAAYTLSGRIADGVSLLTQALEQATATAMASHQVLCRLSLGEAQMLIGHLEEAQTLAERALALARAHLERGNEAYALRLLGDIAARREPAGSKAAEACYRQALALVEELGMRPLRAHCHLGLGRLFATIGRHGKARAELSTAIELYRAMDMTFWLPQAEAALAQMQAS
ncbi:MAG TPA: tetratricopeptide repeat protein [Candidatus Tectomicrobia bacterium]|nr:tetratricopeptide repeat protein [Candidatus Tectomicrobia bacterium]